MSKMHDECHDGITPRPIGRVGIIGVNSASIGIAMSLLDEDIPVTLFEVERESRDKGIALARQGYEDQVTSGAITEQKRDRRMALVVGTLNLQHLKDCDLIIEARQTAIGDSEKLIRSLDEIAKPGAILMTNSVQCDVNEMARLTRRPWDVLGLHCTDTAHSMETWQFVPGRQTSAETVTAVSSLAQKLGKGPASPNI